MNTDTEIKKESTTERAHHLYSPSSLQMREACPCFDNRQVTNEAAVTGTKQHSVTETGIDDETLDDEQALHVAGCLDFYERLKQVFVDEREAAQNKLEAENIAAGMEVTVPLPDIIDLCETYLAVDNEVFNDAILVDEPDVVTPGKINRVRKLIKTEATTAGYVDRALINYNRTRGILLDYKFGAWGVEKPRENRQAIAYVLGLFRKYPTLQTIEFYFKLPQLEEVLWGEFKRSEIDAFYLNIQTIVARAREAHGKMLEGDFSMATPHVPACNFCHHIGSCPKVAEYACKVGHKFHPVEIPADITPTGLLSEDASRGIRLSQVLAVWCKAFRAVVSDRVIRGDAPLPPGFKIESKAKREVVDEKKFKEIALRHVTTAELEAVADYTFGKIEEIIKDKAPRGTKEQAVLDFRQELLEAGAVVKKTPISFLKAVHVKSE